MNDVPQVKRKTSDRQSHRQSPAERFTTDHPTSDDDLSRNVYCVLGLPIDITEMSSVLRRIKTAASRKVPFLISTPNLNFLVNFQSNANFRESLLHSDLCPADGISIVWVARLLGIPIKDRVAGADIFDALKGNNSREPLKVFLFGGAKGVAGQACRILNAGANGVRCVGSLYPGFESVESISRDEIIDTINLSDADFLVISLGAQKGQSWLIRNHHRLRIPIRAHLGAVINFQGNTVKRAPVTVRKLGLEWLWRIKEEPKLWKRYWDDGRALLRLLFKRVLPLRVGMWRLRVKSQADAEDLNITQALDYGCIRLNLVGAATAGYIDKIVAAFRTALATHKQIIIDFSNTRCVDLRFLGLLLMLRKELKKTGGAEPICTGVPPKLKTVFQLNGFDVLLSSR